MEVRVQNKKVQIVKTPVCVICKLYLPRSSKARNTSTKWSTANIIVDQKYKEFFQENTVMVDKFYLEIVILPTLYLVLT